MGEILVPIVLFGVIFGIVYIVVSARHKERMVMIEKGADPSLFKSQQLKFSRYNTFKYGLLLVGIAIGIIIGGLVDASDVVNEETAYFSSILFFGGLALIVAFLLRNKLEKEN